MSRTIAIILAGGKGIRLGAKHPKQFIKIAGKKVIEHTIEVFEEHPEIDEIAIVTNPDYIRDTEKILVDNLYPKVKKVLAGGAERYDSSLAAINAYEGEDVNLIFHDAVRPLVSRRIVSDCIEALKTYNAVDVAVKTTDTIIEVKDSLIQNIPDRSRLNNGQTPQAFKIETIKNAYEIALKDPNFKATDDCGVVKTYLPQEDIYVVEGEGYNMKLTYKEDIFLLDKLFQLRSIADSKAELTDSSKIGLKDKVIVVFGGSYGIGKDIDDLGTQNGARVHSFSRSTTNTDVSNIEDIRNAFSKVYQEEGKIDFVVNTAGILDKQALHNMALEDIQKSVNVNYLGSIYVAKEAFQYLNKTQGSLLLFTSSSYTRGRSLYSLYSSSKAAIVNLTQALSEEWDHVKINCINPERTKTPMRVKNFGQEPDHTLLKSEQVANAAINTLFSSFSGQVIDVKN
ncbi:bifunctional cytidylyltransferase/SDR family oxidoreductase [Aequorivita capsosiphonis]|uniref:bifunctional cytidylyltransferase/SDR family oxidoreductase n=1 Tax=Aequorivita capsosiphonis TaxID=487317 RepID=UPI000405F1A9|nr:bifunctional cytidylyltransferase/SDR family oxidoreductase [Aequorivita capsosiphonis]